MEIPDPRKMYTLNLLAKNESGWSEPSKEFIIDITKPLIPKNFALLVNTLPHKLKFFGMHLIVNICDRISENGSKSHNFISLYLLQ